jgi:hypothetical protein
MPHTYEPKLTTSAVPLADLFNYTDSEKEGKGNADFGFDIPSIQRDFSWLPGVENDESKNDSSWRLIKDLLEFHERDPKGADTYFLGTVILFEQKGEDRLQIMDGQQRITALVCLLSMMRHLLLQFTDEEKLSDGYEEQEAFDWADEIKVDFLQYRNQPALTPKSEKDRKTMGELISISGYHADPESHLSSQGSIFNRRVEASGSPLYLSALLFWKELREHFDINKNGVMDKTELESLLGFFNTLRYRVIVNRTTTQDIGLAYRMFVTANTRGMPLNNFDIFRGLIIARGYQLGIPKDISKALEALLEECSKVLDNAYGKGEGSKGYKEESKNALIDSIMSNSASVRVGRKIGDRNVSSSFEKEIGELLDAADLVLLVEFTYNFAKAWKPLLLDRRDETKNDLDPEYLIHKRLSKFGVKQHQPFVAVMKVMEWEPEQIHELLWLFECQLFRMSVGAGIDPAKKWHGYMGHAKKIYEGEPAEEVIDGLRAVMLDFEKKNNPQGWESISERHTQKKKAFCLLHAIEGHNTVNPMNTQSGLTAEHVLLPYGHEHKKNGWQYSNAQIIEPELYSHRIGNWFLLSGLASEKRKYAESPPHVKIYQYKEMGTSSTKKDLEEAAEKEVWAAANIQDRTKAMIERCEEAYPSDYTPPNSYPK